ncbi:UvrD-helicase domain-containing protein [Macrococcus armenti]|uniref:UvrD-helicase domain-containing protein n=1 Tax=Macrococcus armenti TaxID=2875764 RepID=UPI001CCF33AC|nr:UvrD-helicase domain-containing protein [Macrococcus armenti]UBH15788.1 UvrD-helicase domain-containing protein [Macrococcus armenti]UBH18147.1 UvrD-helicase domain-containing protein [Macrococcus armenti]UBH20414.1 UvrD-helicase domain-containing protein [Macrococcus armenti]
MLALPKLSGKQMEILYLRDDKNLLIKGSAGSGKSLLTMYRSIWLSRKYPEKKVLVLTFNKAVNEKMKLDVINICQELDISVPKNLEIKTYHSFSLSNLKNIIPIIGGGHLSDIKNNTQQHSYIENKKDIIKKIVEELRVLNPENSSYKRSDFVFFDEVSWIQRMNIRSLDEYIAAERIGRQSARIVRADRPYFYEVYTKYKDLMRNQENGLIYDFDDIGDAIEQSYNLLKEVESSYVDKLYDYILIDEFQDFSVNMLTSLQSIMKENGVVNLFGDVKQSIFGKRISMKSLGFTDFLTYNIEQNYRNSKEISLYASKIAESPYLNKEDDFYVKTIVSNRITNFNPVIKGLKSKYEELVWMNEIINCNPEKEIAILTHAKNLKFIKKSLFKDGIKYDTTLEKFRTNTSRSNVLLATVKQVKGLEFDTVIIPFQGIDEYISLINYQTENEKINKLELKQVCQTDLDDVLDEETEHVLTSDRFNITNKLEEYASEIYVSVSRAKNRLYISYTDELFPVYPSLNVEEEV